jgi:ABC-type glycerol-3-phosphate transport system permease component
LQAVAVAVMRTVAVVVALVVIAHQQARLVVEHPLNLVFL